MKKVLFLIMMGLVFGCAKKEEVVKETKTYIISEEDRKNKERDEKNNVPPPFIPFGISGECNLIIDKHSNVFYYQMDKKPVWICNYGREKDTIPEFIDLQPKDLIKIPKNYIDKFINDNVISKEKRKQILIMASQTDTIKDKYFLRFLKNLQVPIYVIRRTTQEEDTVIFYKKNNKYYDSNDIKWNQSRIKFPHIN